MPFTQNITNGCIYSVTLSNTSSLPVTNLPSSVNNVQIFFTNVVGTGYLIIQLSAGSGYVTTGYTTGIFFNYYNTTSVYNQTTGSGLMTSVYSAGTAVSGNVYLYGLNTSGFVQSSGTFGPCSTGGTYASGYSGGILGLANVTAFQILYSGGSMTSGLLKIYGLN